MTSPDLGQGRAGGLGMWARIMAERRTETMPTPDPPAARPVSPAPMASADLIFGDDGLVAWDRIWTDFCDLALTGGPPHRGTMLDAPEIEEVAADLPGYERVRAEIARGLAMTTPWPVAHDGPIGWIGLVSPDREAAKWMARAILAENVAARPAGASVLVPAGPAFTLRGETKNVVTAVAKAWHYWAKHGMR